MSSFSTSSSALDPAQVTEIQDTGVIWSAIIGGTVAASAFLLLLAPLGSGLGFLKNSPWESGEAQAFTLAGVVWLICTQWIASGVGGYLTGRLRTGWAGAHTHEVFFRDTAHGFLTWALTSVLGIFLLTTTAMYMSQHGPMHGASMVSPESRAVNRLFRSEQPVSNISEQDRADASYLLMQGATGTLSDSDHTYLNQLVASRTGLSSADTEKRMDDAIVQLKESEYAAHKVIATKGLLIFLSLWIGAFIASVAGALGGQHRDLHYAHGKLTGD